MSKALTFQVLRNGQPDGATTVDHPLLKIGRLASCHLRLDDPLVSRIHAVIEQTDDGEVVLIDLGALSGTFVNGQRVNKRTLKPGDSISVGPFTLIWQDEPPGPPVPTNDMLLELRELLYGEPSVERWDALLQLLDRATPQERPLVVGYAIAHLETWPDALRVMPPLWTQRGLPDADPRLQLPRTATLPLSPGHHRGLHMLDGGPLTSLTLEVDVRPDGAPPHVVLPALHELTVRFEFHRTDSATAFDVLTRLDAPKLETVVISQVRLGMQVPLRPAMLRWPALRHLTLTNVDAHPELAHTIPCERLETLSLGGSVHPPCVHALFSRPLPALRTLLLDAIDRDACALPTAETPALADLAIRRTNLLGEPFAKLCASGLLRSVHHLEVRECSLSARDLPRLGESDAPATVEVLDLAGNNLHGAVERFATVPWPHLTSLSLEGCRAAELGVAILNAADHFPRLERLNLAGCQLHGDQLRHLGPRLPPALRHLDLSANLLDSDAVLGLLAHPDITRLQTLVLTSARLSSVATIECERRRPAGLEIIHPELNGPALREDEIADVESMTPSGRLGAVWRRLFGE